MVPLLMNYIGQAKEAKRLNDLKTFQTVATAKTAEFMVDPGGTPYSWKRTANLSTGKLDKDSFGYQVASSCQFDSNYAVMLTFGDPKTREKYEIKQIIFLFLDDDNNIYDPEAVYFFTPEEGWKRDDTKNSTFFEIMSGYSKDNATSLDIWSSTI